MHVDTGEVVMTSDNKGFISGYRVTMRSVAPPQIEVYMA